MRPLTIIRLRPIQVMLRLGRYLTTSSRASANVLSREYEMWQLSAEVMYILACSPCRIVATPGKQLGLDDPEAHVTVQAAADVANHFRAPFVSQENHANIALLEGGRVLRAIDAAQLAGGRRRVPIVDGSPCGA